MTLRISLPSTGSRRWSLRAREVLHGPEQAGVFERFAVARLQRVHEHRVVHIADRDREPLEKRQRLVAKGGLLDAHTPRADEVLQHFVQKDQARAALEQFDDLVGARSDPCLVLLLNDLVAFPAAERPRDPAPDGFSRRSLPPARACRPVHRRTAHRRPPPRTRSGRGEGPAASGSGVQRRPRPGAVEQCGQGCATCRRRRGSAA